MRVLCLEGEGAAVRYLSGTLRRMGVDHRSIRPGEPLPRARGDLQAVVISDFPRLLLQELEPLIVQAFTLCGLGLLMAGGPLSFGRGGYAGTAIEALLPAELAPGDDRVIAVAGALVEAATPRHPLLRGLSLDEPLAIVGHNRLTARAPASVLLASRAIERAGTSGVRLSRKPWPLLLVRESIDGAMGRSAALATGLVPPWSGGLTEWGRALLSIDGQVEVGADYAAFVLNLVRWLCGEKVLFREGDAFWTELPEALLEGRQPVIRAGR